MVEVRKAEKADLAAVEACARAAYCHYVDRIGREPAPMVADFAASMEDGNLYVLETNGDVAGFVIFYARHDHLHLENVAVSPGYQQRGFGAILIDYVEQKAREGGYSRVELYTNAKMTENLGLYPRLGYQQLDRRIEDGFDRVYFKKDL